MILGIGLLAAIGMQFGQPPSEDVLPETTQTVTEVIVDPGTGLETQKAQRKRGRIRWENGSGDSAWDRRNKRDYRTGGRQPAGTDGPDTAEYPAGTDKTRAAQGRNADGSNEEAGWYKAGRTARASGS